jgi:hypothetical protein
MRKWFTSLAVLGLMSAVATAQTLGPPPSVGGCGQSQSLFWDDGTAEFSWKVNQPTGALDSFNVDFEDLAGTMTVTGISLNTFQSTSSGPIGIRYVGLCPDNLTVDSLGRTPDLGSPLSMLGNLSGTVVITGNPSVSAGYCPGALVYDIPDVTVATTGGEHTVMSALTGDSGTWLCADVSGGGHSFFTLNNYSTPAISFSTHLQMRIVGTVVPSAGSAYMTLNNTANAIDIGQTDVVAATLWSTAAVQPTFYLQGAFVTGFPFIAAPNLVMQTGQENFAPIPDPFQGTLYGPIGPPCVPAGLVFDFGAFYIDNANLKKNGNGVITLTNLVTGTIVASADCYPCLCFGIRDDGVLDGTIWKVQNPAGSLDFFNTKMDSFLDPATGLPCGTTLTSIEAASWDFCGSGPSWASFGIYHSNTVIDPTGGTPDLANSIALATTLAMAPGSSQFSFPATVYDFPDVTSTTVLASMTDTQLACQWASGDTCTWIASDTDGTDDDAGNDCASQPGTVSYFTLNGYSSAAIQFLGPLWMQRINWF